MIFVEQPDGSFMGSLSFEQAARAANGYGMDKAATIGFGLFCRERGLEPGWRADAVTVVEVGGTRVGCRACTSERYEELVIADSGEPWTLAARIFNTAQGVVVELIGVTAVMAQRPAPQRRTGFLSMREWLRQFPSFHVPFSVPEVAA